MINYLYWGLFLAGILLLYFALRAYNNTNSLLQEGIKTTAVVVKMVSSSSSDGTTYRPIFEFTDRGNTVRTYKSSVSSSPPSYKVGDKVKIVYNPKEDDEVKTITFWGLYRWTIILLCIASPLLIIGGGYLWYSSI